jgi:4-diphosphocytidyl-2-methyl-D-erithritol synthase
MNIAIILAGGSGSRVGADIPKQFIEIEKKPILAYTIEKFQNHSEIDAIEVVCAELYTKHVEEIVEIYNFNKVKWIAKGGNTFQESVINGVMHLQNVSKKDDIVVIHFAASPFVQDDIISDSIHVCREKGNAISTTPFFLLSGSNDGDKSTKWIDRDSIACMNSPHSFVYAEIYNLYTEAERLGILHTVEPHTTTLMYKMKKEIYFSKGNQTNIKITTKEDLELFEGYVLLQKKKEKH